jgi:glyoxylase-like metal-dependent hydrolase (beta-lactamase superfamily II)
MPAGIGKERIEQVILTHSHFDHTAILELVRERFKPVVYARSTSLGADVLLEDGQMIVCGDREMQVLCTPGHSEDSVCLYSPSDGALFVGDTPVMVRSSDGSYEDRLVRSLERLCGKEVRTIYFGHGDPITENAHRLLLTSLKNARRGQTIPGNQ